LARNRARILYIRSGQSSPYELAFRVELGPKSISNMVSEPIQSKWWATPQMYIPARLHAPDDHSWAWGGCIKIKEINPTLARNRARILYIRSGQSSPYELAFRVELGPKSISNRLIHGTTQHKECNASYLLSAN